MAVGVGGTAVGVARTTIGVGAGTVGVRVGATGEGDVDRAMVAVGATVGSGGTGTDMVAKGVGTAVETGSTGTGVSVSWESCMHAHETKAVSRQIDPRSARRRSTPLD